MSADQKPEAQAVAPVPMPLPIVAWLASTTDGEYALAMSRVGAIQRAGSNVDDIVPLTPHAMATAAIDAAVAEAVAMERERYTTALRIAREGYASEAATGLPVLPQWRERTLALIDAAIRRTTQDTPT